MGGNRLRTVPVEHHGPVVVVVAASGGGRGAIELVVGDGQARGRVVRDDEHAANKREFVVVDPDAVIAALEVECVATPYDTGVDVGELDTLNDNVLCVLGQRQAFAFQDAFAADAQDGFVATDFESGGTGSVVGDGADGDVVIGGSAGQLAEVELTAVLHCLVCALSVDKRQAYLSAARLPITAGASCGLASEVKLLRDQDNAGHIVRKVLCKLVRSSGSDSSS
jgi:hypothetical protein